MWSRAELKSRAKECLRTYYWMAFLVSLVAGILGGSGAGGGVSFNWKFNNRNQSSYTITEGNIEFLLGFLIIFLIVFLIIFVIALLIGTFLGNPIIVGSKRFYMESREIQRSVGVGKVLWAFDNGRYLNVVKTMFLRTLFVSLWSLLLVIPGIIKSYEYYMVPYILSENPDMNYKEALALSREMMNGSKWDVFVLELSFFGWLLLGAIPCGLGLPFVQPYMDATYAELYAVLRTKVEYTGLKGFGGDNAAYYDNIVSEQ